MKAWWRATAARPPAEPASLAIDLEADVRQSFPGVAAEALEATALTIAPLDRADLSPLERQSPGLRGYSWSGYLRCSTVRVARVLDALEKAGRTGRLLDVGSYFGNFSLAAARRGWQVDALDSFARYQGAFDAWRAMLDSAGVRRIDFADAGYDLAGIADDTYDAVLLMGVIEHVPHTPRSLLAAARRVLRPGGLIILDTPNIAYGYNRERMARGESVMAPLADQFDCEPPFEGHHREYTSNELRWMLERIGCQDVVVDAYNYSVYGLDRITGDDLRLYREALADPTRREVLFAVARNPDV